MTETHNHYFITAVAIVATAVFTYTLTNKPDIEKVRLALEATINTKMEQFGKSNQSKGNVGTTDEVTHKARDIMGPELLNQIGKTNGSINSVVTALAEVKERLSTIERNQVRQKADGTYEATVPQNRKPLPSLTEINLSFDPKNVDSTFRSQWSNHTERFTASFAQWRTTEDGARSAVTIERKVFKNNTQIGETEVLPITNNEAYFTKDAIERITPFPKYTFHLGTSIDTINGDKGYWFGSTKWFTREFGATVNYSKFGSSKQIHFGASYNYGKQ